LNIVFTLYELGIFKMNELFNDMEKENLIAFIQNYDSRLDKINLSAMEDSQLRTIAQRLISEDRLNPIKNSTNIFVNV